MYRRLLSQGGAVDAASPPEALHELRKGAKKLRYLLELFLPLFSEEPARELVRALKRLQDNLGEHQDLAVQADWLREAERSLAEQTPQTQAAVLMALRAGMVGVPVVFCAGDAACVAEVTDWLPGVATVTTKDGYGHECGLHRRPEDVRQAIENGVRDTLGKSPLPAAFLLDGPTEVEVTFGNRRAAEVAAMLPGSTLDHGRSAVRALAADGLNLALTVELWLRLSISAQV